MISRNLLLATTCTVAGAVGAFGISAISSSAKGGGQHRGSRPAAKMHGVRLGHAVRIEAVVAQRGGTFATVSSARGVVKSVAGDQLTITEGTRKATYQDETFTVPADAKIRRRGTPDATLADLQAGDRVGISQRPNRFVVIAAPARQPRA